ncbi:MAG TPA: hypothetical protein VMU61_13820 [Candidatus Aquilonibacter sp.]|nr:hypothetical protein [Candidatus Aquilonibacter sp.]
MKVVLASESQSRRRAMDILGIPYGAFEGEGVLRFAESVSGSYNFITAMPVSRLALFLREHGVEV